MLLWSKDDNLHLRRFASEGGRPRLPWASKLNAFIKTNPKPNYNDAYKKHKTGNPNEFLGVRKDLTPEIIAKIAKKFMDKGAMISSRNTNK